MRKYSELTKNTILYGISTIGVKIISLLLLPLYTSKIDTDSMGSITIVSTTISILIPLLTLGFSTGIIRFSLDNSYKKEEVLSSLFSIWLFANIILLIFFPLLTLIKSINGYLIYFYGIFLFNTFDILISQFVRGNERTKVFAISGIIKTTVLGFSNIVFLVFFNFGAEGYLISIILSHVFSILYLVIFGIERKILFKMRFNYIVFKDISKFSLPFIPNSLSWWINNASDKYLILYFLGTKFTGIYSVASRIQTLLITVTTIFNQAWQISAVKKFDKKESTEYYSKIFNLYCSFLIVTSSFIIFLSPLLAKYLFLNEYYVGWRCIPFLTIAMQMGALTSYYDAIIVSTKKTKTIFYATMVGAFSNTLLNIILIPQIGILGAAIATLVSYTLIFILRVISIRKTIGKIDINIKIIILFLFVYIQSVLQISSNNLINFSSLSIFSLIMILNIKEILTIVKKILPI